MCTGVTHRVSAKSPIPAARRVRVKSREPAPSSSKKPLAHTAARGQEM
jgi:hypothetical protein